MRPELIWLLEFEDSNYCLGRELEQPPPLLSTSENIGFIDNSCCSRDLALLNKFTWFTQPGSLSVLYCTDARATQDFTEVHNLSYCPSL